MRKLILLLILFLPRFIFSQDSIKHTFKISLPTDSIHLKKIDTNLHPLSNYNDTTRIILYCKDKTDTITLSTLLNSPLDSILRCKDTAKIISFNFSAMGYGIEFQNNPGRFKTESGQLLYSAPKWDVFIINNIVYKTTNGKTHIMEPIRLDFPEYDYIFIQGNCKATLSNKFKGEALARLSEIVSNPEITLMDCGDSSKVISFSIGIGIHGSFSFYHVLGNSLTKEVINKLNQTTSGDLIKIRNIEYETKGIKYIADEIAVRLNK
jgi:hypothetical protein